MHCEVAAADWSSVKADWLVVGLPQDGDLSDSFRELDEILGGTLNRLRSSGDLTGKLGEVMSLRDVPQIAAQRLLICGLGEEGKFSRSSFATAMRTASRSISDKPNENVVFACPQIAVEKLGLSEAICVLTTEAIVGCVGQGLYHQEKKRHPFGKLTVLTETEADAGAAADGLHRGHIIGESVNVTRELVNRPASDIYPETVANQAEEVAAAYGLKCHVFDEQHLRDERMGSMLAVAQGSDRPPRMVVLTYSGAEKADAPSLALVGKGVTFDSGGLSLKPSDGMKEMKMDMAGAATVFGVMVAAARLELKVNLVGYLGLVENMVSGNSYKLGDVLTARNGTTIEVLNTDAEGRLVLADVLSYAVDQGADHIVDLATLTGACMVALGTDVVGAFTNNQPWCNEVLAASGVAGEDVWELPMFEQFGELLKSDVADCKNVGPRWGGAITAAKFLEKFVDNTPWVHLDIAGPAFASSDKPSMEGGATGVMVRTLVELAAEYGANRD
ncbi:leucyl aminopeptidase [Calycomorphotria hydatis]|uniref:Probable cytosol aminopeptidase n=1 Tax=Calycomorphotria hydatis TaxID=2528027 RepID=A0A517TEZ7_9PLAN|nr:leucyl aminopeptidase [Calycomorphotria hydatis]QDT66950.1 Cytosol aminopeptidase [Calycomorphotria hydatis]